MESEKNRHYNKYGKITFEDIKNSFLGIDDGTAIEWKQLVIAMIMLIFMLISSVVSSYVIWPGTFIPVVNILMIVLIRIIFLFNSLVFKEEIGAISKFAVVYLMLLYVIGIFFQTGGIPGVSGVWIIFLITFTSLILRRKPRIIVLITELIAFSSIGYYAHIHPEKILNYPEELVLPLNIYSIFQITTFIVVVIILQTRLVMTERNRNRLLQEELLANNEELQASNDEIMEVNHNLEEMTEQLNDALASQKMFTASMNHELRAPLNGVMGGIQVLKASDNLTKEQHEILNASFHSANALIHIVNDLLDYAKIEAGEFQIIKENFNLKDIIEEIPLLLSNMMREKGLEYILEVEPDMPCLLYGDGTRIQQILSNLFSNAVKYTFRGSITLSVKVADNNLVISVKDTGEGISDEAKEVLFTPFKRLNEGEHKKIQGTGLGLYVTHNLVNQMCGTISVESKLGVGSTFTVVIPIEIVDEKVTYANNEAAKKEQGPDFSHMNILCVDDSSVNLLVFEKLINKITRAGITTANSGAEALEIVDKEKFDVIFLDFQMPEMDGMQTLMNIRDKGITTPIVVLTGETGSDVADKFRGMGFDGYVSKPMKPNEVIGMMARFAGMKK